MSEHIANNSRRFFLGGALAAIGVGGTALWAMNRPRFDGDALSPEQAHSAALAGEIHLIDIRRPDEWARTGVAQGAVPLDMRRDDFEAALLAITDGARDVPIALMCARGVRSGRMSARLTAAGFTRIIDVPEGMLGSNAGPGWLARNLPVRQP